MGAQVSSDVFNSGDFNNQENNVNTSAVEKKVTFNITDNKEDKTETQNSIINKNNQKNVSTIINKFSNVKSENKEDINENGKNLLKINTSEGENSVKKEESESCDNKDNLNASTNSKKESECDNQKLIHKTNSENDGNNDWVRKNIIKEINGFGGVTKTENSSENYSSKSPDARYETKNTNIEESTKDLVKEKRNFWNLMEKDAIDKGCIPFANIPKKGVGSRSSSVEVDYGSVEKDEQITFEKNEKNVESGTSNKARKLWLQNSLDGEGPNDLPDTIKTSNELETTDSKKEINDKDIVRYDDATNEPDIESGNVKSKKSIFIEWEKQQKELDSTNNKPRRHTLSGTEFKTEDLKPSEFRDRLMSDTHVPDKHLELNLNENESEEITKESKEQEDSDCEIISSRKVNRKPSFQIPSGSVLKEKSKWDQSPVEENKFEDWKKMKPKLVPREKKTKEKEQ